MDEIKFQIGRDSEKRWRNVETIGDVLLLELFCEALSSRDPNLADVRIRYKEEWDEAGGTGSLQNKYDALLNVRKDMARAQAKQDKKWLLELRAEEKLIMQALLIDGSKWLGFLEKHRKEIFSE